MHYIFDNVSQPLLGTVGLLKNQEMKKTKHLVLFVYPSKFKSQVSIQAWQFSLTK